MFQHYLAADDVVNWQHPEIQRVAAELAGGLPGATAVAQACFEFVRDEVRHSVDAGENPVTCRASDVLQHRTGYCYAKSHLLAALLRANGIAAGFCYQRLRRAGVDSAFCLHGLNAVWLDGVGWYRIDSRGNKPGVSAQFTPPREALAFRLEAVGEQDMPGIFAAPLAVVTDALQTFNDWQRLLDHLPDLPPHSPVWQQAEQAW